MNIDVQVKFNIPKHLAAVRSDTFWIFAASELHRLLTPYIPMQTGTTMETVMIRPKEIEFYAPNAHFLHKGELMVDPVTGSAWARKGVKKVYAGKELDLTHNKHPKSAKEWENAAMPTQRTKLVSAMQGYLNAGRLDL